MQSDNRFSSPIAFLATLILLAGCGGGSNRQAPPPPAPDSTAPTLGNVDAGAGFSFNRSVSLTVTANDNVGVTEVRFFVDGNLIGSDTTPPFTVDWDTATVADGDHQLRAEAEDAAGNVGQSAELTVTVANTIQLDVTLSGVEEVPAVDSNASAVASITVNLASGDISGDLTVSGVVATAAHLHDGFAGQNGPVLVGLEQDGSDPTLFSFPAGATLDSTAIDDLLAAGLYLNAHSAANPGGEVRGQVLPDGFSLLFSSLSGDNEVPQVASVASGRAAVTVNDSTGTVVIQVQTQAFPDASAAHLHDGFAGSNGPVLVALAQDAADTARWFVEDGVLAAGGLDALAAGRLYVNVHSPENPGGELRGQVIPEGIELVVAELSGEQEVPAIDTRASAVAFLTRDVGGDLLTINVNTLALSDASMAHLHSGFAGTNGPVEIGLTQDGSDPSRWFVELESLSVDQVAALETGATYLNVHTPANPGGEVRGQVIPEGIEFAIGLLEGAQEVPSVASSAGGTFAVTVNPATLSLDAHVNTTGADDATAAHLHDGYAGTNGPVLIGLTQDAADVRRWSASGVTLDADQLVAFESGRIYVNVHTPANPAGEVRGQVAPPPVEVLFTELSGEQEVPAIVSAASGRASVTTNRETGLTTLYLRAEGADDATAAHLHGAYAGSNGGVLQGLTQDSTDPGLWSVVEAQLDAAGLSDYLAGRTYINLHTPANPSGEIRGQVVPDAVRVIFSAMDGDQVVPSVVTTAAGVVATTANLDSRRFVAFVNSTGVDDAISAGVHTGAVGANGAEILPLAQSTVDSGQWSGETEPLPLEDFQAFRAGGLYVQVATPSATNGEIRGQIVPDDANDFDATAPEVAISAPAASANVSGTVTIEATATDNLDVTAVRFFADGDLIGSDATAPYSVEWDTTTEANGNVALTAEADDAAGNTGASDPVVVAVANVAPVTLAQIQAAVFTPACSGCHSGPTSGSLPSGMNLSSASASFSALVNVASQQVGSLNRVTPGDPDNSYLIQKLEGTNTVGSRMPQGGPFLDQATVDEIRQWISDGALNN